MIIAGAGGHGLEIHHVLINSGMSAAEIMFFDQDASKFENSELPSQGIFNLVELEQSLSEDPRFVLGVGNPVHREKLFLLLTSLGGSALGIQNVVTNESGDSTSFDAMPFSFIGPETTIGKGVLINTRANVHHQCSVGDFSEIGPAAMLLGASKIGKRCRIGAGAVILPGVELGDEMIVGAGAVVTKTLLKSSVLVGIPAQPLSS
ncbi:DapH/DapD/GlmU-related protein [uncultured Algoriphagus sp.]|uniref:DapH/DapD/GlmU-related protein n=1 Tax=uncultured Algoriphagus sp. TaxID=417365 RepID=UPI0030EF7BD6|tara:strand:+ start:18281 stop:18895 length:615 start_codon:yes stop_codon:yes gene_type:complete